MLEIALIVNVSKSSSEVMFLTESPRVRRKVQGKHVTRVKTNKLTLILQPPIIPSMSPVGMPIEVAATAMPVVAVAGIAMVLVPISIVTDVDRGFSLLFVRGREFLERRWLT